MAQQAKTLILIPGPRHAVFSMPGYHIWDPSVLALDRGGYLLFASRWSASGPFEGWKQSEIICASSDALLGPYRFERVVFQPGAHAWDREGTHNPKILRLGRRYLLYYLGIPSWKTGFAWADDPLGSWQREAAWHIPTNNPALVALPESGVLCVGKKRNPNVPDRFPWSNWMQAFRADHIMGPYEEIDPSSNRLPNDYELEDPTLWWDGTHYNAIVTDWKGKVTGIDKAGVHYTSPDGVTWHLVSEQPVFGHSVNFEDGELPVSRRERPEIILDSTGKPCALATSFRVTDGEAAVVIQEVIAPSCSSTL